MEINIVIKDKNGETKFTFDSCQNAIELLQAKQDEAVDNFLKEFKKNHG